MSTRIQSNKTEKGQRLIIPAALSLAAAVGLSSASIREAASKCYEDGRAAIRELSTDNHEETLRLDQQNAKNVISSKKEFIGDIFDAIKESKEKQEWVRSQGYKFDLEQREEFIESHQLPYDVSPEIKLIAALNVAFDRDKELQNNLEKRSQTLELITRTIGNSQDTIFEGSDEFLRALKEKIEAGQSVLPLINSPEEVQTFINVSAEYDIEKSED
jgi:chaperonin GroEL (HSP60 family)